VDFGGYSTLTRTFPKEGDLGPPNLVGVWKKTYRLKGPNPRGNFGVAFWGIVTDPGRLNNGGEGFPRKKGQRGGIYRSQYEGFGWFHFHFLEGNFNF